MSKNDSQDKTEQPTPQKLDKARKEGNVARSKELTSAVLIMGGGLILGSSGEWFNRRLQQLFSDNLNFDRAILQHPALMVEYFGQSLMVIITLLAPLLLTLSILSLGSGLLPGGFVLSGKNIAFKASKLDPIKGLGRMFSAKSLVELVKSILKISLISLTAYLLLKNDLLLLLSLPDMPLHQALGEAVGLLSAALFAFGMILVVIAVLDLPYQLWEHKRQLKMTKQEIKEEHKGNEGNPEVKGRMRQIQQQMARQRVEVTVPEADVVLINPEHYSVAIKYDPSRADAPFVVAKGQDALALHIRTIAKQHGLEILRVPPLARAVYYNTRVDQEIPGALYVAVAQVLNHVLNLKAYREGRGSAPAPLPSFSIPNELKH